MDCESGHAAAAAIRLKCPACPKIAGTLGPLSQRWALVVKAVIDSTRGLIAQAETGS